MPKNAKPITLHISNLYKKQPLNILFSRHMRFEPPRGEVSTFEEILIWLAIM